MSRLRTLVDTKSEAFAESAERFGGLMDELRGRSAEARRGGGEKAQRRHRERGKLPVRERIERLLDPGTAFLELSSLAAFGMYDGRVPAAGIVTGGGGGGKWRGRRSVLPRHERRGGHCQGDWYDLPGRSSPRQSCNRRRSIG